MSRRSLFRLLASSAIPLLSIVFAATVAAAESPKTLHDFAVKGNDGSSVYSSLTLDAAGNLYGTTVDGGQFNEGIVFELSPTPTGQWKETILYSFKGGSSDGANPHTAPVFDSAGNLYGSTVGGGLDAKFCNSGCGVVYKLTPSADGTWTETILYTFLGGSDGAIPLDDTLALDASGDVFGLASSGGDFDFKKTGCVGNLPGGCGVAFEVQQ